MSNFKVIENLDVDTSLIIIDEKQLSIDDRYFSIYREKYDIKQILEIIKEDNHLRLSEILNNTNRIKEILTHRIIENGK